MRWLSRGTHRQKVEREAVARLTVSPHPVSLFPLLTLFLPKVFPKSSLDGNAVRLTVVFNALDVGEETPCSPSAQLHPQHGLHMPMPGSIMAAG